MKVGGGSVEPKSAFQEKVAVLSQKSAFQEKVGGGSVEPDSAFQEKVGFLP